MAGKKNAQNTLNNTLKKIAQILNDNNLNNWFIAYGTLLGIIRNNNCIEHDDDVDIVIDHKLYDILKNLLIENGFEIEYGWGIGTSRGILKTKDNEEYCSVDFYMAQVKENGDYVDNWEKVNWTSCYQDDGTLIKKEWNDVILNIPNNPKKKLLNRYGDDWHIPKQSKGKQFNHKLVCLKTGKKFFFSV